MQQFKIKRILFFTVILLIFTLILIYTFKREHYQIVDYQIEGKNYRLLLADTPKKWSKGLMYKRKLTNADGMLFVFPDKRKPTFYNKNTYLDLDVYWIDGSSIIAKHYLASIEKTKIIVYIEAPTFVDKVAEIVKK
ncbi:MAG: DUF192 domain-containing protein [Elusimicrobiota bacterium]|nr:DUF192 domain-containing protein [Endomicrobiia bacterium]MCX7910750.1 DUF192 domain-containing protein [Endomicrobiia bacterium]MDW8165952.1 DUF192 domain-containing protein [Elusimicrobiota bacterium]